MRTMGSRSVNQTVSAGDQRRIVGSCINLNRSQKVRFHLHSFQTFPFPHVSLMKMNNTHSY